MASVVTRSSRCRRCVVRGRGERKGRMSRRTSLLGLSVDDMTRAEAVDTIRGIWRRGAKSRVFFVNAHCVNAAAHSADYRDALREAEFALPSGSGVLLASRLLRLPIRHDLNGTDLTPMLCKAAGDDGRSIFLLGGGAGIAEQAATVLRKRYPKLRIAGARDGCFRPEQSAEIVAEINAARPDVLLVALGVPTQELWITEHFRELEVCVCLASEALFDFLSSAVPRAPRVLRRQGAEWLHWLYRQPRQRWKRYLLGNTSFLGRVVATRLGRRPTAGHSAKGERSIPASGMLPPATLSAMTPLETKPAPKGALPIPRRGNVRWSAASPNAARGARTAQRTPVDARR